MSQTQELIRSLGSLSYIGIFGVSALSNMVIPVPEEVVLLALGYLSGGPRANGIVILPIVIAGLFVSDCVIYALSRKGNRLVTFLYKKFFAPRIEGRREWIEMHITKVIFFARFMIQLRFLGPFMAGQMQVSWRKFITYDLAALIVYVSLYMFAGWYFRERIELIVSGIGTIRNIVLIVIGLTVLFSLSKLLRDVIFGGYKLSLQGRKRQGTWIPGIYKVKK